MPTYEQWQEFARRKAGLPQPSQGAPALGQVLRQQVGQGEVPSAPSEPEWWTQSQPRERTSVLGDWWQSTDLYKSYGKHSPLPSRTEMERIGSLATAPPAALPSPGLPPATNQPQKATGLSAIQPDMPERLRRTTPTGLIDNSNDAFAAAQRGLGLVAEIPTMNAMAAIRQGGGSLVDVMPTGVNPGQRVVAHPSQAMGMGELAKPVLPGISAGTPPPERPFYPTYDGSTHLVRGEVGGASPKVPLYQTQYDIYGQDGRQGTASITGANQRAGGGTLSVLDQGNGGTVEGNVAALNRQIEAMRSLREASNPTRPQSLADLMPRFDPFSRPGDSYGDSQRRASEYEALLKKATPGSGLFRRGRESALEAAKALIAPGLEGLREQGMMARTLAGLSREQGITPWQLAQYGLDQQRFAAEQQYRKAERDDKTALAAQAQNRWQTEQNWKQSRWQAEQAAKARQPSLDQMKAVAIQQLMMANQAKAAPLSENGSPGLTAEQKARYAAFEKDFPNPSAYSLLFQ